MNKISVHVVAGARPNFMKIAPILRALAARDSLVTSRLIHTGQHYDSGMSDVFFQELGIPAPDFHLGAGGGSHAEQTARVMVAFEKICQQEKPDVVVVVGDVNSTLACSVTARKLGVEVAHVEAGLRSGDLTMPEEINRLVTDSISDYYFVTEQSGVDNLLREGKSPSSVFFVGHVMIDNLFHQLEQLKGISTDRYSTAALKQRLRDYGVVTLHRPSNVDDATSLAKVVAALAEVSERLPLIFPVHPRTRANLQKFEIAVPPGVTLTEPLPYMEFLNLWKDARVVLTDSGGIQEETTALGVPCVTLRENTERPVTVTEGTNILVGSDRGRILAAVESALRRESSVAVRRPPMWDGRAAERIVGVLIERCASGRRQ